MRSRRVPVCFTTSACADRFVAGQHASCSTEATVQPLFVPTSRFHRLRRSNNRTGKTTNLVQCMVKLCSTCGQLNYVGLLRTRVGPVVAKKHNLPLSHPHNQEFSTSAVCVRVSVRGLDRHRRESGRRDGGRPDLLLCLSTVQQQRVLLPHPPVSSLSLIL